MPSPRHHEIQRQRKSYLLSEPSDTLRPAMQTQVPVARRRHRLPLIGGLVAEPRYPAYCPGPSSAQHSAPPLVRPGSLMTESSCVPQPLRLPDVGCFC